MTLANMSTLLAEHRAVGAFNFVQLELAQAIVAGAEEAGTGVVLQLSQNAVRFHGALAPAASAALALASGARVPVVVHLDHATDEDLVDAALAAGVRSVMFDGAHLPDDENVARTRAVADRAHAAGAWVEAELGEVGGKGGAHTPGVRTDVEDAAAFVAATGVDALAVAVGSSHAMTERAAALDEDLISRLAARVPVPLVLHGSSGVPDDTIVAGIDAGLVKINVSTHLNAFFTRAVRAHLDDHPAVVDSRKYIDAGRSAVVEEAARLLQLFASPRRVG